MKTKMTSAVLMLLLSILIAGPAQASDKAMSTMSHNAMKTMDKATMDSQDNKFGDLIHESDVDGYKFSYYFMDMRHQTVDTHGEDAMAKSHDMKETVMEKSHDMKEMSMDKSQEMKGMDMEKPHHLMVYINKGDTPVLEGKVGFLIVGEDGTKQQEMCMFMSNGFGATADMKKKGTYTIKTKAVVGGKKLKDSFVYEIK